MPDFKKEWLEKANMDYFSQFMTLWLGFNSWYRSHYSEVDKRDRAFIDKLKADFSGRNQLYTRYCNLIAGGQIKENLKFKSDLESLYYSLNRGTIKYPTGYYDYKITFGTALYDYSQRKSATGYINLIKRPRQPDKIKLDEIYIINNNQKFCACLFEIIYQIRCYLFHGDLAPNEENHEVIKYCYFILWDLMN
ncbi:MAG: hypothetical protein A2W05_10225 [Candidatus Schekmanbacteria bacterium RBG_16_38_10]|uniref:Uncharacterized protein n=1 Tax=Candidatus Schekmanbacteria bacterium RBG_16_38_10 TaxID=1817879 RepID=A0A1F7RS44_9BACT|nr:MAG: hypothetical protein A2W05_10225 [Candidatus Schekmanbacteria bacterium RBG_16_38_10]